MGFWGGFWVGFACGVLTLAALIGVYLHLLGSARG